MPDGIGYRLLVLPDEPAIALPVLRKAWTLARAGVPVVGPTYAKAEGLRGDDAEARRIVAEMRLSPKDGRSALSTAGVPPDFEASAPANWVHRRDGETEIYFVSNPKGEPASFDATFRVAGKAPELWDAVTGERRFARAYVPRGGRTSVPLDLPAYGSTFVVFRRPSAEYPPVESANAIAYRLVQEIRGPWTATFDPRWGGPASIAFDALDDWSKRPEPGVRYYSGTTVYRKTFDLPASLVGRPLALDLGTVWAPPFRVDLGEAPKAKGNVLEIEVVNFWPNRIVGDAVLGTHFTQTNVRKLTNDTPLMPSGLLGPVRLVERPNGIAPVSSSIRLGQN